MDSCHIFNFLFGTRKATSELRKCFGVAPSTTTTTTPTTPTRNKDKRYRSKSSSYERVSADQVERDEARNHHQLGSSCSTPFKQVHLKLAADGSQSVLSSSVSPDEIGRARVSGSEQVVNQQAASGIFEAQLVRLAKGEDQEDDARASQLARLRDSSERQLEANRSQTDENNNNNDDECDNHNDTRKPLKVIFENPANKLDNLNELAKVESSQQQTINVYDNPLASQQKRVGNGANQANGPRRERPSLSAAQDKTNSSETNNENKVQPEVDDKIRRTRSERIHSLVQSFEVITSNQQQQQQQQLHATTPTKTTTTNNNKANLVCLTPRRLAKAPETPPKSARAKCLNHQLSLRKPTSVASLFQSETFLVRHFFDKLAPLDRCAAAQVCRKWRDILYANQAYWSGLTGVIDCTQLRREQLAECIMNTLQSAKLRLSQQQQHQQQVTSNGAGCRPAQLNHNHQGDQQRHLFDLGQLDQDEIWRIQELCNRHTMRAFSNGLTSNTASHLPNQSQANRGPANLSSQQQHDQSETTSATNQMATTTITTTTTSGIANSKSSSSQISSSTLSSVSISSLLSPLSESSRVDSIKERLYGTLEERGFVSICLFGATDDDIDELVARTRPNGARRQLKLARLCNCALSDRGLETLAGAFGQIEQLELIGCNEITNGLDLRPMRHLRRLVIMDCINIADGLAQRIVEVVHQLETLVVQAYHLTDAFLEFIALGGNASQLKRLELPNCKEITNATALTIAKHFHSIETLSLSGSAKINDDGVELVAEHMKSLVSLDLGWLKIGDLSLECLACDLRHLRELILDRNIHITDLGLSYLATMANLSLLYVRWCPQLTDKSIASISNMRSLTSLSLAGLHQITARGILSLLDSPQLEELELTNCPAVTSELQRFLSAKMPNCSIVY